MKKKIQSFRLFEIRVGFVSENVSSPRRKVLFRTILFGSLFPLRIFLL